MLFVIGAVATLFSTTAPMIRAERYQRRRQYGP
jgi:hypothetical protein